MKLSDRYRIYPNRSQREALDAIFYSCRSLYNSALEERITHYKKFNKGVSYSSQCKEITGIDDQFPEFANIYSQTRQQVLKTVDTAFKRFFERIKGKASKAGFPRFKNKFRFKSILFPQVSATLSGQGGVKLLPTNKHITVFGIPGNIKIKVHRPFLGRCKQARIVREPDGKFFLAVSFEDVPLKPLPKTGKTIGIDLGLNTFLVGSDGTKFHSPKPYKTSLEKLQHKQRKLATKLKQNGNKRSNNVVRLRNEVAKAHSHIANIRKDFAHKTTLTIVKENDILCHELLDIQEMIEQQRVPGKLAPLNRNITDAGWGQFLSLLNYKAERAGKTVVAVPPKDTSKMCSRCGHTKETLSLADRIYHCEPCGLAIDRDLNAAINIHRIGMILATGKTVSEAPAFKQG